MSKQPLIDQLDQAISGILGQADTPPAAPAAPAAPSPVDASHEELLRVARDLRDLPSPAFRARLKAELERKANMSTTNTMTTKTVKLRAGFRTITPYLHASSPEYLDFLKNVFDAKQTERTDTGPGRFHAEFQIGDSMVMLGVGPGRALQSTLLVYVDNADEIYQRALNAGATSVWNMTENYGDRFGGVLDQAGNTWCIATFLGRESVGQEHLNSVTAHFSLKGSAKFVDFLKQAFDAQEIVRYDTPQNDVAHAKIRIGDSAISLGELRGDAQQKPAMIYMYVPDCDAVYAQALRAGAKSISPVADQFYGDRHGGVEDPWGNQWYIATPL
jgi:PhnB protein